MCSSVSSAQEEICETRGDYESDLDRHPIFVECVGVRDQASVVQMMHTAILQINHYPVDKSFQNQLR